MKIKSTLCICLILLFSMEIIAQENLFLSRDYWKLNPSVEQIKTAIVVCPKMTQTTIILVMNLKR